MVYRPISVGGNIGSLALVRENFDGKPGVRDFRANDVAAVIF